MSNIHDIKNGLTALSDAIETLQSQPSPKPEILDRGLSGNKINGGMITNFKSVGIVDEAKEVALTVHNDGITVTNIYWMPIPTPVVGMACMPVAEL